MKLTNDSYVILINFKTSTERYYRDKAGWVKVSTRGREFRATAEQVLNHVLPALAGIKPNVTVKVALLPVSGQVSPNCSRRTQPKARPVRTKT